MSRDHVTVDVLGERLVFRAPYECREVSNALPGVLYDKSERAYHAPRTPYTLDAIMRAPWKSKHPRAEVLLTDTAAELHSTLIRAKSAQVFRTAEELIDPPSKTQGCAGPWGEGAGLHQRQAFYFGRDQESTLFLMVMSSGKSKLAIDLMNEWDCKRVLIVCPNNVQKVWPKQFRLHSLNDYHVTDCRPFKRGGGSKKRASVAERAEVMLDRIELHERVAVVLNYESFWRQPMLDALLGIQWDCGLADEVHRAAAAGAKAGRALDRLRPKCARRLAGTGSKSRVTGLEAYGVCRWLDPGLFGTSYKKHKLRYGKPRIKYWTHDVDSDGELVSVPEPLTTPNGEIIYEGVKDEARDDYMSKLAQITYECGDEVLDLPNPVQAERIVELGDAASRMYGELEAHLVAQVADADTDEEAYIIVDNVLSKYLRLQQLTSGIAVTERDCPNCDPDVPGSNIVDSCPTCKGEGVVTESKRVDTAKQDAVADYLDDLPDGEPVVIFAKFIPDLDAIREITERKGLSYAELSGRRKDALTEDATLAEHCDVAAVQIQAGGVGIDLTRARHGAYYSVGYSLDDFEQSWRRIARVGMDTTRPVEFVHFIAEGTIDEDVYEALKRKEDVTMTLVRALRAKVAVAA